tara:strand:- start:1638 stop:2063 length:426 start_codon:yes stop_codon:yes gene_type:complete
MEKVILKRNSYSVTINEEKCLFKININSIDPYNEEGLVEFLTYFKNTWLFLKDGDKKYKLYAEFESKGYEHDIPLIAYTKIAITMLEINKTLEDKMTSVCIFSDNTEQWNSGFKIITAFWDKNKTPILLTDSKETVNEFLK